MKTQPFLILAAGVLLAPGLLHAAEPADAARKDKQLLQGSWRIASVEVEGQDLTQALNLLPKDARLTIKEDEVCLEFFRRGRGLMAKYKLDTTATPKLVDFKVEDNPLTPETVEVIYEVSKDAFKVCVSVKALEKAAAKERPTDIKTKRGSGTALVVFKRQKDK